ncbi:IS30 family transposase [Streptosporangium sandarakinum]|uniref:IS30 family transposase n=1 Tax=Streptosporangium sandarakinum TaxID=1260955 RepID=UPI0036D0188B
MATRTAAQRREEARAAYDAYLAACPARELLDTISDKWVSLILNALADGPLRYSDLGRIIAGVSQKMLTQTLRGLKRDGLVSRTVTPSVPVRVDYALTDLGRDLQPVMGSRPPAIATLAERTSRYVVLVALPDGIKAAQVRPHLTRVFTGLSPQMRRSLTWDRGREMAEHRLFSNGTGVPVCFCKRRSPWQRGISENTNGLLRQHLARSADLRHLTQEDLDGVHQ